MATTGHESEVINVQGLKASLQKYKSDIIDPKVPSSQGTQGQVLASAGNGNPPVWTNLPTIPSKMSDVAVMSVSAISSDTSSSCSITGAGNTGKSETIVYTNSSGADLTVTVPTTYATPDGAAIELTCHGGGYCEVNYLNIGGTIYARGL